MEDRGGEDDDLKLQRASIDAIAHLKDAVEQFFLLLDSEEDAAKLRFDFQGPQQTQRISALLDFFQEDPQLLDPHLRDLIIPLICRFAAIVDTLNKSWSPERQNRLISLAAILYTICKVRGEKVFTGFLDNEPTQMAPILAALETCTRLRNTQPSIINDRSNSADTDQVSWKLRYILLTWIGHLILTPFPLDAILPNSDSVVIENKDIYGVDLPVVGKKLVNISLHYAETPTRERTAAALLLSKLALRPDIASTGLLTSLVEWGLGIINTDAPSSQNEEQEMFVLEFLHGLMRSANVHDISSYLPIIFQNVKDLFRSTTQLEQHVPRSATTKKWALKVLRGTIILLLQIPASANTKSRIVYDRMLHQEQVLDETIDILLGSLADRDTQVRYAASKSISVITLKLEKDMAEEIVEAIFESLNEDLLDNHGTGISNNLDAVNPLRWHGLTLTLSYMLFRRSPSPSQLGPILDSLYRTLTFEQRSATGNSLGTNVRDATNFGLWSLARMYTTKETLKVDTGGSGVSKIQSTANKLLASACLDPSGNVRRGSSAALQELVGRHPDTIENGISLVQIVDYQAVGLRKRAMIDVSSKAAQLHNIYLLELLEGAFGWRGLLAPDTTSRNFAAKAIGQLIIHLPQEQRGFYLSQIISSLRAQPIREIEARHGLTKALAEVLTSLASTGQFPIDVNAQDSSEFIIVKKFLRLFDDTLKYSEKDLSTSSLRPELITEALLSLVHSMRPFVTGWQNMRSSFEGQISLSAQSVKAVTSMVTMCLKSLDEATLAIIPEACASTCGMLSFQHRINLAKSWLEKLDINQNSRRRSGILLALASIWDSLSSSSGSELDSNLSTNIQMQILESLIRIFDIEDVDARVMSIRSLSLFLTRLFGYPKFEREINEILELFARGLNDYTTNERGDVGSLVRLEAVKALTSRRHLFTSNLSPTFWKCYVSIQRLALERLDKVRLQAARCLSSLDPSLTLQLDTLQNVSNFEYLSTVALSILIGNIPISDGETEQTAQSLKIETFLEGFASCISGGSDTLSSVARSTVAAILFSLPFTSPGVQRTDEVATARHPQMPSTFDICGGLVDLIKTNLTNDRVLLPLLELSLFLFDAGIFQSLIETLRGKQSTLSPLKLRTLLYLTQKSHYKSTNLPKLLTCVQIYGHLVAVPDGNIRGESLKKLGSMLSHPFATVRVRVGEVLWSVTGQRALRDVDWGLPPAALTPEVKAISALLAKDI